MYDFIRYKLVPPTFIVVFTGLVQVLALCGRGEVVCAGSVLEGFLGNFESWTIVVVFSLWAYLWLILPGQITRGPPSPTGYIPIYKDNGLLYYFVTLSLVVFLDLLTPLRLSALLYDLMPQILGTLDIIAMLLCTWLFLCPSDDPDPDVGLPSIFIFYRGLNFHPRILGVDVKQLTNCRIGLMAWQILVWAFFVCSVEKYGFSMAAFTTFALQAGILIERKRRSVDFALYSVSRRDKNIPCVEFGSTDSATAYLTKFFYWESGYFHTIDIILDRAGYYICWGCLVWVPCFYTFTSYYLVHHEPKMGSAAASGVFVLGLLSIYLNYSVDKQKQLFRSTEGNCQIWGKPAEYVIALYVDHRGEKRKNLLLTSGFWGTARHLNYDFELLLTLCWCLPGLGLGLPPFFYFIFLFGLLTHRVFRDEEKCRSKYGLFWDKYCEIVRYRMIPYIF